MASEYDLPSVSQPTPNVPVATLVECRLCRFAAELRYSTEQPEFRCTSLHIHVTPDFGCARFKQKPVQAA